LEAEMNRRSGLALLVAGIAIGCVAGAMFTKHEALAAQRGGGWDYRIVTTFIPKPVMEKFNKDRTQVFGHPSLDGSGAEGWELVAVLGDADNSEYRQFFFKRPR
jgi:hypothetical protein